MSKMIGVLVSHGYGAGWSSWGDPESALDQELVAAFEREATEEEILRIGERNWPNQYNGGLMQCKVHWVEEGTQFRIEEYDGSESLEFNYDVQWTVAK